MTGIHPSLCFLFFEFTVQRLKTISSSIVYPLVVNIGLLASSWVRKLISRRVVHVHCLFVNIRDLAIGLLFFLVDRGYELTGA